MKHCAAIFLLIAAVERTFTGFVGVMLSYMSTEFAGQRDHYMIAMLWGFIMAQQSIQIWPEKPE